MKLLFIFLTLLFSFICANSTEITLQKPGDSIEIKKWTKEDFINELGFNDSAKAMINLFFTKNKRGKNQTIIGGAFLIGGVIALAIPSEPGDDQKGFGDIIEPVVEPGAVVIGAMLSTSGIVKLGRYTKEKLHSLLSDYKKGAPIPESYRKKLKQKYFLRRQTITPRF
jgi:hypothetical protein